MGKLGGGELNFSSDVDLVLLFPEHGETGGPLCISNEEFFTRLVQALVRLLEAPTAEGFVLRVDLRLRPFGDSGPVAVSFAFFEESLELSRRFRALKLWLSVRYHGLAAFRGAIRADPHRAARTLGKQQRLIADPRGIVTLTHHAGSGVGPSVPPAEDSGA